MKVYDVYIDLSTHKASTSLVTRWNSSNAPNAFTYTEASKIYSQKLIYTKLCISMSGKNVLNSNIFWWRLIIFS